jgi:hypothetical protein
MVWTIESRCAITIITGWFNAGAEAQPPQAPLTVQHVEEALVSMRQYEEGSSTFSNGGDGAASAGASHCGASNGVRVIKDWHWDTHASQVVWVRPAVKSLQHCCGEGAAHRHPAVLQGMV